MTAYFFIIKGFDPTQMSSLLTVTLKIVSIGKKTLRFVLVYLLTEWPCRHVPETWTSALCICISIFVVCLFKDWLIFLGVNCRKVLAIILYELLVGFHFMSVSVCQLSQELKLHNMIGWIHVCPTSRFF